MWFRAAFIIVVGLFVGGGAFATPTVGINPIGMMGATAGCSVVFADNGILSGALNSGMMDESSCEYFNTYQVTSQKTGQQWLIAECATCKTGLVANGLAISRTRGGDGGTVYTFGDYAMYNLTDCGEVGYQYRCSAKSNNKCSVTGGTVMDKTSLPNCKYSSIVVVGSDEYETCRVCDDGYTGVTTTKQNVTSATCTGSANIAITGCEPECRISEVPGVTPSISYCKTPKRLKYGSTEYNTCLECNSGYYLDYISPRAVTSSNCPDPVYAYSCLTNCDTATEWVKSPDGTYLMWRAVESITDQGKAICRGQFYFQCPADTYGTVSDERVANCTKCPTVENRVGKRAVYPTPSGNAYPVNDIPITACYEESGEDDTGEYDYVSGGQPAMCYYKLGE